jgi:hypothetical protein
MYISPEQVKHTSSNIRPARPTQQGSFAKTRWSAGPGAAWLFLKESRTSDRRIRLLLFATMLQGRGGRNLRSSLVYAASKEIPNRFQLCQTISKAARVLHLSTNPTEITINRVLQDISHPVSELKAASTEGVL